MGASMAIHSGARVRARECARDLYEAFANSQGIRYDSSMNAGAAASQVFPSHPVFHLALGEKAMLDPLKHADSADKMPELAGLGASESRKQMATIHDLASEESVVTFRDWLPGTDSHRRPTD
jgi:hypothetical protein